MCGQQDFLVFPDKPGALTWTCPGCDHQRQTVFRKDDYKDAFACPIEFNRIPMDHGCTCGERDIIVLPKGRGELRWTCDCGRTWRMAFDETSGEVFPVGSHEN